MSHTPGPWRRYKDKTGRVSKIEGRGRRVCTFQPSDLNAEANASLIAAAPELLEALKEIKARLEVYDPTCPFCGGNASSGHRYTCLWHVANAALREARGEE